MSKLHILQVIGARPQVIKSAAIWRAANGPFADRIRLSTLDSAQHYDHNMSGIFYEELGMSVPELTLERSSGEGTNARMSYFMKTIEGVYEEMTPDAVLVYGDTDTTLAAAICAQKANIPVIHVEAGLRSHNLKMPEECNRIATDHLSTLLFAPTPTAIEELGREGLQAHTDKASQAKPGVHLLGDIMYDNVLHYSKGQGAAPMEGPYILATCHRPSNSDSGETLAEILQTLEQIGRDVHTVVLPVHPRLHKHESLLSEYKDSAHLKLISPLSFIEINTYLAHCELVITDSGGLQKESYFHEKPCLVLRDETEWVELVENGNSILVGNQGPAILKGLEELMQGTHSYPKIYGDGRAAEHICEEVLKALA